MKLFDVVKQMSDAKLHVGITMHDGSLSVYGRRCYFVGDQLREYLGPFVHLSGTTASGMTPRMLEARITAADNKFEATRSAAMLNSTYGFNSA